MSTLNQAMLLDGQALSNNDPNMVITLKGADAAKVEITSIGNDSITYSFKEGVPTDTLYDLSLSFVYKELYTLEQPLSLVNIGTESKVTITSAPINTQCWARGETLPFTVSKGGEDVTANVVDVVFTPKSIIKAGDTGSKSWTIESESAFGQTTIEVDYTFRLSDDLPGVTRSFTGTFIVAAYDGQELTITPLFEEFKIPVGTLTPLKFSFKYRNYRDASGHVRYLQNFATTTPINYSSQDLKKDTQEIWVTFGASASFTGEGTLVFGGAGANSVVGKNRVDIKVDMRAYVPGLVLNARNPTVLTGKQNQEVEQTITISMDGDELSMEDVTIEIANPARLSVVSKVGKVVTFKILGPNDTGADINNFTNITYSYGGLSKTQIQSIIIKPMRQVTALPANLDLSLPKLSTFDYPVTLSDGNGVEYQLTDPKVKVVVPPLYDTSGSLIDKYETGIIGKVLASPASQIVAIAYDITIDGVPGTARITAMINLTTQTAPVGCDYAQAGSLAPNQETVAMNNKYQIGGADVTVDKVLLTKYVNNPSTGNAIIELLDKPTTTNNIGFGRNAKTGWTGALAEMTEYVRLPGGNIVYKATGSQQVAQATIDAIVLNDTFNYADGVKTDIFVTLTQKRLGQEDWKFTTSTDIRNISVSGTVKAATVINENGTFRVTVTGNGTKGAGSVTYSVVENGVHYPKRIELQAINGINIVIQEPYKTVYGMSNSDILVQAIAQYGGTNLGDTLDVTSDNPTITVKSVSTVGGRSNVILTSPAGTELAKQPVKLTWTVRSGTGSGATMAGDVTVYITSNKLMAYDLPHYVGARPYQIAKGMLAKGAGQAKTVILKDGVRMNPRDQDITVSLEAGTDPLNTEYTGIDSDGNIYIKVRSTTVASINNRIGIKLKSDPTYSYAPAGADGSLTAETFAGGSFNAIINVDTLPTESAVTEKNVTFALRSGVDNTVLDPYVLIWSLNSSNPNNGDAFYNKDIAVPTVGPGGYELTVPMKFGHTGDTAQVQLLVSDKDGTYRNGVARVNVDKSPIVVVNNGDSIVPPNTTTSVTLTISQKRWENDAYNLAGATLVNPTVANNLFTVTNMVNNNDGTITFDVTTVNEGTAKLSFTVKDGEFEYPASVDLTVQNVDNFVITTTPLTLKLWETKPLVFTIVNNGVDISSPVTSIKLTGPVGIESKYELVNLSSDTWGIKAVSSSPTEEITANAELEFTFMDGGTEHVMSQTVSLTTEINNGEIPTNRFNVEFL